MRNGVILGSFVIIFCIVVYLLLLLYNIQPQTIISPIQEAITKTVNSAQISKGLEETVTKSLEGTEGEYGVVIKNLKTAESYSLNEDMIFESASIYKLWVMATAYNQIENDRLNLSTVMKQDIPILNDKFNIASESAEKIEGTLELTVRDALLQMITYSDNYSALLLAERVRLSNVTTFLENNEFVYSKIGQPPRTTPKDTALFLEKLYKGELVSKNSSENMLGLLKQQRLRNKLPKYLPVNVEIAHKTGELDYFTHDAGIVYTNKGDYIIVVFSKSDFPKGAEEKIAQLSKDVYLYFTKN